MSKHSDVTLSGKSGKTFTFGVYVHGTPFNDVSAVYAVLRDRGRTWDVLYVGESGQLGTRHNNHHRAADFRKHSATHVAVHRVVGEERRKAIETDLVQWHEPLLNKTAHG